MPTNKCETGIKDENFLIIIIIIGKWFSLGRLLKYYINLTAGRECFEQRNIENFSVSLFAVVYCRQESSLPTVDGLRSYSFGFIVRNGLRNFSAFLFAHYIVLVVLVIEIIIIINRGVRANG